MDIGGNKKLEAFEPMELRELSWMIMETGEDDVFEASTSTIDSSSKNSTNSIESSSSELTEDASSSSTSNRSFSSLSPSSSSSGPLYELSELMANLPIKRGLSKFYNGKSESFTSLASAKSLEDLAKRVNNNIPKRKMKKSCKSSGGGLDAQRSSYSPKPLIAKKASKGSFLSPVSKRNNRLFDSHS